MGRRFWLVSFDEGPEHYPPLGLLVTAQVLAAQGWSPRVFQELPREAEHLAERALGAGVRFVGFYVAAGPSLRAVASASRALQREGVRVIWGGPLPSTAPEVCAGFGLADVILSGPAETAPGAWLGALEEADGKKIQVVRAPDPDPKAPSPYPDPRWLADPERFLTFRTGAGLVATVVASRGCRRRCAFCAAPVVSRGRHRYPRQAVEAAWAFWKARAGAQAVEFGDDELFDPVRDVRPIAESLGAPFFAQVHARTITEEAADWLAEAGCVAAKIGAESGSDRMLAAMGKGCLIRDIRAAVQRLADRGLAVVLTFIAGLPEEGPEDLKATVDFVGELADISPRVLCRIGHFVPYPGTRYWARSLELGFEPPKTLEGWARLDSGRPQVPWVPARDLARLLDALNERYFTSRLLRLTRGDFTATGASPTRDAWKTNAVQRTATSRPEWS